MNNENRDEIYRRNLKNIDNTNLIYDFNNNDWNDLVYTEANLDAACEQVVTNIETLIDKHAPLKRISKRRLKYFNKPWIDKELLSDIKNKNKLFNLNKQSPTAINKENFRKQRNRVTAKLRSKKRLITPCILINLKMMQGKCGRA